MFEEVKDSFKDVSIFINKAHIKGIFLPIPGIFALFSTFFKILLPIYDFIHVTITKTFYIKILDQ